MKKFAIIGVLVFASAVSAPSAHADYVINTLGTSNANTQWGSAIVTRIAQSLTTVNGTDVLTNVATYATVNGGAGQSYYLTLEADAAGVPSGTPLDTSTTVSNANSCSTAATTTFSGSVALAGSMKYWLVFHGVSAPDAVNYNGGCGDTDSYAGGTQLRDVGGWSDQSIDEKLVAYFVTPGGGGGGGSTATATTTAVDNPTQDYFMGVMMFYMAAFFIVFIFKRSRV